MTQDQKPNFTDLALKIVGTASLRDPINVRIESAIQALNEAHDLGVERSAKEMDEVLDLKMDELVASKRQIRQLKLGKGE